MENEINEATDEQNELEKLSREGKEETDRANREETITQANNNENMWNTNVTARSNKVAYEQNELERLSIKGKEETDRANREEAITQANNNENMWDSSNTQVSRINLDSDFDFEDGNKQNNYGESKTTNTNSNQSPYSREDFSSLYSSYGQDKNIDLAVASSMLGTTEYDIDNALFQGTELESFYDNCSGIDYTTLASNYRDNVEKLEVGTRAINYILEGICCESLSSLESNTLTSLSGMYNATMSNISNSLEPACAALKTLMYDCGTGKGLLQELKEGEKELYGMQGDKEGNGFAKSNPNIFDLKDKLDKEKESLLRIEDRLSYYRSCEPPTTITMDRRNVVPNPDHDSWQNTMASLSSQVSAQQKNVDEIQKEIEILQARIDEKRKELNSKLKQSIELINLIKRYDQTIASYETHIVQGSSGINPTSYMSDFEDLLKFPISSSLSDYKYADTLLFDSSNNYIYVVSEQFNPKTGELHATTNGNITLHDDSNEYQYKVVENQSSVEAESYNEFNGNLHKTKDGDVISFDDSHGASYRVEEDPNGNITLHDDSNEYQYKVVENQSSGEVESYNEFNGNIHKTKDGDVISFDDSHGASYRVEKDPNGNINLKNKSYGDEYNIEDQTKIKE